jgi:hypothetical protein
MEEKNSNRHSTVCAVVLLSLGGLIIAACSSAPGAPAPVYMMGMAGTSVAEPAATPAQQSMEPVALANWSGPSAAAAHTATDVIPLDDPPAQSVPATAREVTAPLTSGTTSTMLPSAPGAQTVAVAASAPAAPLPAASPTTAATEREPSAAEEARAEAPLPTARPRTASEPARAEMVMTATGQPRPAPYSKPSYYWP